MVQLLVKFFDYILVNIFSNVMIAQKIFRWWAQMAEDNLFHDILIIGTSSWDYEDNFDPISRKKKLISRKNLHFLCLLYFLCKICVCTFCVHFIVEQRFTVS